MNIDRKLEIAKEAIASITRHDDAPAAEVATAAAEIGKFINAEMKAAGERRAARAEKPAAEE